MDISQIDIDRKKNEYMERFDGDEDTVEYLLDMDREMIKNYRYMTYITWPEIPSQTGIETVRELSSKSGLELLTYEGSDRLIRDFVSGNWNEEDFLILEPGKSLEPSYDKMIIKQTD